MGTAPAAQPKATLGVLFVHGIGEQLQGQTLVMFADPLSSWLTRWLTDGKQTEAALRPLPQPGAEPVAITDANLVRGEGPVCVSDTDLVPGEGPAHCYLTIRAPDEESFGGHKRWLLAESWWAETFRPPKTTALMTWLLLILPYMILTQFYVQLLRRVRRTRAGWLGGALQTARFLVGLFVYLCALPVAALGGVVAVLLLVALFVPIPQVRDRAKKVALLLSNTLGDSYVLTSSTVQFDGMVARVVRDLEWLSKEVEHVAVVAHSQGAAVAYEAIRSAEKAGNLTQFITVGQGLKKLMLVRKLQTYGNEATPVPSVPRPDIRAKPDVRALWRRVVDTAGALWKGFVRWISLKSFRFTLAWCWLAAFYILLLFVPQLSFRAWKYGTDTWWAVGLGGGSAFVVVAVMFACGRLWEKDLADPPYEPTGSWKWADFYASADPVANGPLFTKTDDKEDWLEEKEVWNLASFLRDHTTYTRSEDDFLGCLVRELFLAGGGKKPSETTEEVLKRARWRGWWRVWWLSFARVLALAGVVATTVQVWGNLKSIGGRVIGWHWGPLRPLGHALLKALDGVVVAANPSHRFLVGLLVVAAVAAAGYVVLMLLWNYWERQDVKRFYRRTQAEDVEDPLGGREFLWFFSALCLLSVVTAIVGWTSDYAIAWNWGRDDIGWVIVIVAGLTLLPVFLTWAVRDPLRWLEKRLMEKLPRDAKLLPPKKSPPVPEQVEEGSPQEAPEQPSLPHPP